MYVQCIMPFNNTYILRRYSEFFKLLIFVVTWKLITQERHDYRESISCSACFICYETDEAAWNVFDMFSKIRLVLFRSLLESLGRSVSPSVDAAPSRKSHLLRSNLLDMLEELRSVENEKGFVLVASVLATEIDSPVEFLQREVNHLPVINNIMLSIVYLCMCERN